MQTEYSGLEVASVKPPHHSDLEVTYGSMKETPKVFVPDGDTIITYHHEKRRLTRPTICGLRKVTFWLTLTLATTIIIVIVGGSVGGTLLHKSHANKIEATSSFSSLASTTSALMTTSFTSTTSTTSSAVTSGSTGLSSMDCVEARTLASEEGVVYREYCAEDWPNGGGGVRDISQTTKYTFQACIDACDSYNAQRDSNEPECLAVTYDANLTSSIAAYNANCYLKNKQGSGLAAENSTASAARAH